MTSPQVAVVAALLLASPVVAIDSPAAGAARYDKAYDALRLKAKTAYLSPSPIDAAVTTADLNTLAPAPPFIDPPERKKKTAEFVEALKAVKTLQGGPGLPPVPHTEKVRLMAVVYDRLGLTSADQTRALDAYASGGAAPFALGPGSGTGPSDAVANAARYRELEGKRRAERVMGGVGALREDRSAGEDFASLGGLPSRPGSNNGSRFEQSMTASEFKPRYKSGQEQPVPKPGVWSAVVEKAATPLPGTAGWKERFAAFSAKRMAESNRLELEGAAHLEKGGIKGTFSAGVNAVKGFGHRLAAADSTVVKSVAIGAAVVGAAVVAAPLVAGTATVMGVVKVGLVAWTAYGVVSGTADLVKQPDYANAGGLALNLMGAKYAGAVAEKVGAMTQKVVAPVIVRASTTGTQVAVKVGHEATMDAVGSAFKPGPEPIRMASAGPFAGSVPTASAVYRR